MRKSFEENKKLETRTVKDQWDHPKLPQRKSPHDLTSNIIKTAKFYKPTILKGIRRDRRLPLEKGGHP